MWAQVGLAHPRYQGKPLKSGKAVNKDGIPHWLAQKGLRLVTVAAVGLLCPQNAELFLWRSRPGTLSFHLMNMLTVDFAR